MHTGYPRWDARCALGEDEVAPRAFCVQPRKCGCLTHSACNLETVVDKRYRDASSVSLRRDSRLSRWPRPLP
eukprot:2149454-Prorocentrum_lima.AAC.1